MQELFTSGRFIDLALTILVLEVAALYILRRRRGRGLRTLDVLGHLAAGALLLLGLRCVLVGADYRVSLALLAASFPAHLYDLARRARAARDRA